jgi:hypothetical protein
MGKMNYGDQPYIVYVHEDIDRRHIHIVSICVDETGRKISDSYEHRRSMTACRELEIQYGLKNIADERKESDKLFLKKVEYEKGDVKHQISNVLKNVSDYKFRTFGEYSALLSCFDVEAKTVKGEGIDGKPFNGIVYSATGDNGKSVSNPFKSSLFGKSFGYEGLNKKMARNEKDLKEGKYAPMIRSDIAAVMKTAKGKEDFIENSGREESTPFSAPTKPDGFTAQPLSTITGKKSITDRRSAKNFPPMFFTGSLMKRNRNARIIRRKKILILSRIIFLFHLKIREAPSKKFSGYLISRIWTTAGITKKKLSNGR